MSASAGVVDVHIYNLRMWEGSNKDKLVLLQVTKSCSKRCVQGKVGYATGNYRGVWLATGVCGFADQVKVGEW